MNTQMSVTELALVKQIAEQANKPKAISPDTTQ